MEKIFKNIKYVIFCYEKNNKLEKKFIRKIVKIRKNWKNIKNRVLVRIFFF